MDPLPSVAAVLAELRARRTELPPGRVRLGQYGDSPELSAWRLALIRAGRKRAGTSLPWAIEADGDLLPETGDIEIVIDHRGAPALVTRLTRVRTVPFNEVTAEHAGIEGESDGSLACWREGHWEFFSGECRRLGLTPAQTMPVACCEVEVVNDLASPGP